MRVYRALSGPISFCDYEDAELVYERDSAWERPSKEEREARRAGREAKEAEKKREWLAAAKQREKDLIFIISQAFYGNRTGTEIYRKKVDRFMLGCLDDKINISDRRIDRTIVRIPDTENLVLIYNKYEEEERRESAARLYEKDGYVLSPLAVIPELELKLYSRCIVCRMNADGELASLEKEDCGKFMKYLAE